MVGGSFSPPRRRRRTTAITGSKSRPIFSAYHISPKTAENYLQGIRGHAVEYMTGYTMSNYFLARMFDELSLEAPELRAVVVSSEKLKCQPLVRGRADDRSRNR